jgi:hypothetical protein
MPCLAAVAKQEQGIQTGPGAGVPQFLGSWSGSHLEVALQVGATLGDRGWRRVDYSGRRSRAGSAKPSG